MGSVAALCECSVNEARAVGILPEFSPAPRGLFWDRAGLGGNEEDSVTNYAVGILWGDMDRFRVIVGECWRYNSL